MPNFTFGSGQSQSAIVSRTRSMIYGQTTCSVAEFRFPVSPSRILIRFLRQHRTRPQFSFRDGTCLFACIENGLGVDTARGGGAKEEEKRLTQRRFERDESDPFDAFLTTYKHIVFAK